MKSYSSFGLALITFYSTCCAQNAPENNAQLQNTLSQSPLSPFVLPNQYVCTHPDCNQTFVNGAILRRHKHTHKLGIAVALTQLGHAQPSVQQTPPLPAPSSRYTCPHSGCNQTFANQGVLRRHQNTHKNSKPHQCIQCKKRFSRKDHLKEHTLIHTNPNSLTCTHCKKMFAQKHTLTQHMLIHNNPNVLTCTHCKKTFTTKSNLRAHILIHTNPDALTCTHCKKTFSNRGHLKKHTLIHTNPESLTCTYCNTTFSSKKSLRAHMKRKHQQ